MKTVLAAHVRARAAERCEYCRLPVANSHFAFEIDHIVARKHGGPTIASNLVSAV